MNTYFRKLRLSELHIGKVVYVAGYNGTWVVHSHTTPYNVRLRSSAGDKYLYASCDMLYERRDTSSPQSLATSCIDPHGYNGYYGTNVDSRSSQGHEPLITQTKEDKMKKEGLKELDPDLFKVDCIKLKQTD